MLKCIGLAQMKPYLTKKKFVLHLQIMLNVKSKKNVVSLSNQDYMIAEIFLY